MANELNGNPWLVDTAATITTSNVFGKRMVWTPTTDGDDILVESNDGSNLWSYKAIAGDTNEQIAYEREFDCLVNGITVTTIDHGTLYIYVR